MILTGPEIARQVGSGRIKIEPFDESRLSPNSYDFLLGREICWYEDEVLDCRRENRVTYAPIPDEGMTLRPGKIYLAGTSERMGSEFYVPIIRARSSIARLGLFVHVTADLIDIGSINNWTLQLHAVQPVTIYPEMRIGQVTFWCTEGEIKLYDGKYQNSTRPMPSMIHRDFTAV
ncbi:dCTP deaminase [Streptomyces sp. CAU 1734]|uniref:dCTP deaminase n=1 Tax=Streptomyces sp. CAU 1734 TaxID=3140360 RepID=UPI003260603C